ncbi:MAG: hypothetical protein WBQ94_04855 [Terracidiphilus sp.]
MKFQGTRPAMNPRPSRKKVGYFGILAVLATVAISLVVGGGMAQTSYPRYSPEIIRAPDRNQVDEINKQQTQKQNFEAANAERKKQINAESIKLLKLATDLKAEVDKTSKDTLSMGVIRKADEIEKLAHDVKEKMKLSVGSD